MASSFDDEVETPEMETLASLAENVVYRVPGCADVMVRKTLQDVYRDFCRRSCCLCGRRHFTLSYDDPDVVVHAVYGGVVESIAEVRYNRRKLGERDYVVMGNRITFRDGLIPYEGCPDEQLPKVDVLVVEIPAMNAEQVPGWFVQQYGEVVVSGVLAKLMSMGGRPWSDAAQSQIERLQYENAVNEARTRYYAQNRSGDLGRAFSPKDLV